MIPSIPSIKGRNFLGIRGVPGLVPDPGYVFVYTSAGWQLFTADGRAVQVPIAFANGGFSPAQLFAAGEQGVWYDPSDLTTLFQDSSGTTPVTTAGQPVGLMMDKSGRGNHATQATSAARPTYQSNGGLHWLAFDGVNDSMVTPSITPGVDKAQVFAGVRKPSDAGTRLLIESGLGAGKFYLAASEGAAAYSSLSTGSAATAGNQRAEITAAGVAPDTAVLTATHDIATDLGTIRRNGVAGTSAVGDKGAGNFLAYPLYIGERTGTALFFSGNLYGMTVRFGANLAAGQIASSEAYLATKTGVTLP